MSNGCRQDADFALKWETSTRAVVAGWVIVAILGWFALRGSELALGFLAILATILFVIIGIFAGAWYSLRNVPPVHDLRPPLGHRDQVIQGVRVTQVEAGVPYEIRREIRSHSRALPAGRRRLERGGNG